MPIPVREVPGSVPRYVSPKEAMTRNRNLVPKKSRVRRQRDPIPMKYCILSAFCGLFLLGGFFAAANFHFRSVSTAMKNSELRQELNQLKDEHRKLTVNRSKAASPARIGSLAKPLGFGVTKDVVPVSEPEYKAITTSNVSEPQADVEITKTVSTRRITKEEKEALQKKVSKVKDEDKKADNAYVATISEADVLMGER